MSGPLQRIRRGALLAAAAFIVSVVGLRSLDPDNYDWLDAVWCTVITLSSVGFSETSTSSDSVQLLSIGVILVGMFAVTYTASGIGQLMLAGEIERIVGRRRMTKEIDQLQDHVIICGYGRTGQVLAQELRQMGRGVIIIDRDEDRSAAIRKEGFLHLQGDATDDETLVKAGIHRAKTLVAVLPNDAQNVFISLTARSLCEELQIISRAEQRQTEKKLQQAGANRVVMPMHISARQIVGMITRPSAADLIDLLNEQSVLDVVLDELVVPEEGPLSGRTVGQTEEFRERGLLVVAVKKPDGKMIFNPAAQYTLCAGETLIIMGHHSGLEEFRKQFNL